MPLTKKLWIGIFVLIVLTPLGIILPAYFKAGGAWGEWDPGTLQKLAGYLPQGLHKFSGFWDAPCLTMQSRVGQRKVWLF